MARVLLGIVLGVVLAPLCVLGWFRFGHPPVAVLDKPFPMEEQMARPALAKRIAREATQKPAIQADEATLVAGAEVYRDSCAACHGLHNRNAPFAAHMYPRAPQLWEKHANSNVVGVSDDPPAETYWKVANGIRLTGMPAYKDLLTDLEIWQVSLLLANADKPLPPAAIAILHPTTQPVLPPDLTQKTKP
jgi:mono/diheme cytochrome c family protein